MISNPSILDAVERLDYCVTVGDVATHTGLELNLARQGLIELASQAKGNLRVTDTGEIIYVFARNFRDILRNKFWRLRLQEWLQQIWQIVFYLIRISFGIVLIISILLMLVAISIVIFALMFGDKDSSSDNGGGGGDINSGWGGDFSFGYWFSLDMFNVFSPSYYRERENYREIEPQYDSGLNFLEAIFSFLFGDGNPNADLEKRRWKSISAVINNNRGAIVGEQITPYLDELTPSNLESEDYILPVLVRFNGYPEVSEKGEIVYYFPDLQVTVDRQQKHRVKQKKLQITTDSLYSKVSAYLSEEICQFSRAGSGQKILAVGLGSLNILLALILGYFVKTGIVAQIGGFVGFVASIYWILLGYGVAFLSIPLIRYFFLQWRNQKIEKRNQKRQLQAEFLEQNLEKLRSKLDFARKFARRQMIGEADIAYTTETDLLDQNMQQQAKLDAEWEKRLNNNTRTDN
jgi:cell division protein FtsB